MPRTLFIALLLISSFCLTAQRFKATSSDVHFFSQTPIEDIEARNIAASSIIDISTNAIAVVVPIKSFDFAIELMQEHFNENYLESDKFPNATFKGKIEGWDQLEGTQDVKASGTMNMHGVEQKITIEGVITKEGDSLQVKTVFPVKLADYKIKIPKAVFYKIAEEIEITAAFNYSKYEAQ